MKKLVVVLGVCLLVGCSSSFYDTGRSLAKQGHYDNAIKYYQLELGGNVDNPYAWRDMGIAYYNMGKYIDALDALEHANSIQPNAQSHLYVGMIHERTRDLALAQESYQTSLSMQPRGRIKKLVRKRLNNLIAVRMRVDVKEAVAREGALDVSQVSINTIAVVEFDNSALPSDLAALGKGLAAFTASDLSKVQSIDVVDRLKINMLLRELELSQTELVDPATRLRVGRLMGSGSVLSGTIETSDGESLKMHGIIGNTLDGTVNVTEIQSGSLSKIYKIQKDFVFGVIQALDIDLTLEERDAIEEVPTESLLAFMAYCKGLDYMDKGQYELASEEFNKAASMDGEFSEAQEQSENVSDAQSLENGDEIESVESFEGEVAAASEEIMSHDGLGEQLSILIDTTGFMPTEGKLGLPEAGENTQPDPIYEESLSGVQVIVEGHINE